MSFSDLRTRLTDKLFEPVDIASLAFFRVAFGIVMLWGVYRYFDYRWIEQYFIPTKFSFTYEFFDWVRPWPGEGMYFHFYLLEILSVLITVGLFYRVACVLFFLAFAYFFLLEQANYLNHYYLVVLVSFLMIFLPAHRNYSIDAWLRKEIRTSTIPFWPLFLIQFQIGGVYVFGALAKMNRDWIGGEPVRHWLAARMDFPLIGQFFDQEWAVYTFCFGGLLLDLLAPFLLLERRARPFMMTAVVIFHFMNVRLFNIGIFPWLMIPASLLFFPPDWPRQFFRALTGKGKANSAYILTGAVSCSFLGLFLNGRLELVPAFIGLLAGGVLVWTYQADLARQGQVSARSATSVEPVKVSAPEKVRMAMVIGFVSIWVSIQILVPLRHYFIPGNVSWTEEGHRFSWHMKLRSKSGIIMFAAHNTATGEHFEIDPRETLTSRQYRKMSTRPILILQFAHYLADQLKESGHEGFEVRAISSARLNHRFFQTFIDPEVDLSRETYYDWKSNHWILPFKDTVIPKPRRF